MMGDAPPDPSKPITADVFPHPELLAMLGHELRNPLAPIRNSAALLRTLCTDPRQLQAVELISRSVVHLTRMLDDLLDGVSFRRGSLTLTEQRVDVAALVNGVVGDVAQNIESRRQNLHISLPSAAVQLRCDPLRLTQILDNLLSQANRQTPDGGSISLLASTMENDLVIDVIDDGAGIDPAVLPHIFNMFAPGPQALDRSGGALGAELVISRHLAEMHGGTLVAASPGVGQGSRFTLRLPLASAATDESPLADKVSDKAASSLSTRVLIIEDNEDIALSFSLVLSQVGFVILTANSGEQGLAMIEQFMPDVVLLDIGLPGINGFEVARRLRQMPMFAHILLIALSGFTRGLYREDTGSQFDHYLAKPVDPIEVATLIDTSLVKSTRVRE